MAKVFSVLYYHDVADVAITSNTLFLLFQSYNPHIHQTHTHTHNHSYIKLQLFFGGKEIKTKKVDTFFMLLMNQMNFHTLKGSDYIHKQHTQHTHTILKATIY